MNHASALHQMPKPLAKGDGETLLLACGALAREVLALKQLNHWDCFTVDCLPADLHFRPDLIAPAVQAKIRKARDRYQRIFVLYADCGTGGELDRVLAEEGVERIGGPHCYSFFDGNEAFEKLHAENIGTFYLTDFSVRHFETFIWKGLWLDRHPELLESYFGNYSRVVYQIQAEIPGFREKARAIAARLGLAYEERMTGYGDLAGFMEQAATVAPSR
jgi:hypothetical protein